MTPICIRWTSPIVLLISTFVFHINISNAQNALSAELMFEPSCQQSLRARMCRCDKPVNDIRHHIRHKSHYEHRYTTKCCCVGTSFWISPKFLRIRNEGRDHHVHVQSLFMHNVSVYSVLPDFFKEHRYLKELIIESSPRLEKVSALAFSDLRRLLKLQISDCPNLSTISGTLLTNNTVLRSLVLKNNALATVPSIHLGERSKIFALDNIDLSGNRIKRLPRRSLFNVSASNVLLNANLIAEIEELAFEASNIARLDLSANPTLHNVSMQSFSRLSNLRELDLSDSSIQTLPTVGLSRLTRLRLENVPTLKQIPPVLAFQELKHAQFTYPYHCCFFKFVAKEIEGEPGIRYKHYIREFEKSHCVRQTLDERKKRDVDPGQLFDLIAQYVTYPPDIELDAVTGSDIGRTEVISKCVRTEVEKVFANITCTPEPHPLNPCGDIISPPGLRLLIWPISICAILGNIGVWIIILSVWHRRLRYHYFFMLNLAVADFLTGVYLAFLAAKDLSTASEYYNHAVEWQTGWGCSLLGFANVFASELSIVSMFMIALEIYYNVKLAFYGRRMSAFTAYGAMFCGYLYAFTVAALPLVGVSSYSATSLCLPLSSKTPTDVVYLMVALTVSGLLIGGMIVFYVLINQMVRKAGGPLSTRAEDRLIFRRTMVLVLTNMLCWLPTLFFGFPAALGHSLIDLSFAKFLLVICYPVNSNVNPILYVFVTKIWSEARRKAPFLERLSNKPEKVTDERNAAADRYYYLQSPGEKGRALSVPDEDAAQQFLQVTQTTSLNSTPRGSGCSAKLHRFSNGDLASLFDPENRRSSRTSMQLPASVASQPAADLPPPDRKRRSIPAIPTFRVRVSAVPEMSDISESSSNSAEDYERRTIGRRIVGTPRMEPMAEERDHLFDSTQSLNPSEISNSPPTEKSTAIQKQQSADSGFAH